MISFMGQEFIRGKMVEYMMAIGKIIIKMVLELWKTRNFKNGSQVVGAKIKRTAMEFKENVIQIKTTVMSKVSSTMIIN